MSSHADQHDLKISTVSDIYDVFESKGEPLAVRDFRHEGLSSDSVSRAVDFGYLTRDEQGQHKRTQKGFDLMEWAAKKREELAETRRETERIKAARLARS